MADRHDATDASGLTVDQAEVDRFSRIAAEWWNPTGKFRPLHKFSPVRLSYLKRTVSAHFGRDANATDAFAGLTFMDIGCGGGLLAEPLARLGGTVTGIDPSRTNIAVAKLHSETSGLAIDYRMVTAEDVAAGGETFDVVLAMEVVEHVADVSLFLTTAASLVRPGGLILVATINRTLKALALAIVGAEYVLRWLPRGTHSYEKLVRPPEIEAPLMACGLEIVETIGVTFNPLTDKWSESKDTDVNYMILARRK